MRRAGEREGRGGPCPGIAWQAGLAALWLAAPASATVLDFEFLAAGGAPTYRSTTLQRTLGDADAKGVGPALVLVETPSLTDERYRRQIAALRPLDAEALSLFFVTACPGEVDGTGHSTTRETAKHLARGAATFRVRVVDGRGVVLKESDAVLAAADVKAAMRSGPAQASPPAPTAAQAPAPKRTAKAPARPPAAPAPARKVGRLADRSTPTR